MKKSSRFFFIKKIKIGVSPAICQRVHLLPHPTSLRAYKLFNWADKSRLLTQKRPPTIYSFCPQKSAGQICCEPWLARKNISCTENYRMAILILSSRLVDYQQAAGVSLIGPLVCKMCHQYGKRMSTILARNCSVRGMVGLLIIKLKIP